jgi:serine O-acetyltransferase
MGIFRRDAIELARAQFGDTRFGYVLKATLTQDSYAITTLNHLRALARRWHVPLVNTLLRRVQTVFFGIEIGKDVSLGAGVYFVHPFGVVIGGDATVGDRVRFYGSNTVGTAKDNGYPVIEHDVTIGAGARILGPVRIGARAQIGANAVVLQDIPPDSVAVGIPARVIARHEPAVDRDNGARIPARNGVGAGAAYHIGDV